MQKLRRFVCRTFGPLSVLFLVIAAGTIRSLFRRPYHHARLPRAAGTTVSIKLLSSILLLLAKGLLVWPLLLGVLYGMAWWTAKKGKTSVRGWTIAASIAMLVFCIPQFVVIYYLVSYAAFHHAFWFMRDITILAGASMGLGILGIVAFARREEAIQPIPQSATPPRVAGDGTSSFLDGLVVFLGFAGFMVGERWWAQWAHAHHLPPGSGGLFWPRFILVLLITTTLHELGHAGVGRAVGMKLRSFLVGPFQWTISQGRWKFQFTPQKILAAGGAVGLVPTNPRQSQWNDICMIAGGPMASLLTGLVAAGLALTAPGRSYEHAWGFFALLSTIGVVECIVNLLPLRPDGFYSDGARIYQLLKGGPWADLHRALAVVMATTVTPLRPRDYDIEAIQRASLSFVHGPHAVLLRLFASSYYLDRGELTLACEAVSEAESVYEQSAWEIPAGLCIGFAYRIAFLRRDAVCARRWWDRMEAKKPIDFSADYWLAQTALFWCENRLQEARDAWDKGSVLVEQLPAAGDYEFDRYRCSLLRQALDEAAAVCAM